MSVETVLTVSDLTGFIKELLERGFDRVSVEGEVSNFRPSAAGHWYFVLKDENAVLPCVMFKGDAARVPHLPRDGQVVRLTGSLSVYAPRGAYQLIARTLTPAGMGQILEMLQARKEAMAAAGLFSNDRQLPRIPRSIALVTSPTGAAVRDFLQVIERRRAPVSVRILPTPVQGDDAPPRIARAIRYASRHKLGDVIVVTRGGGSVEDLLAFSDPEVIRAIHEASVPVLSAIGHEIDWALSDYAADLRAPTPSAAAEIVSISREEITTRLSHASFHVREALTARLTSLRQRLSVVEEHELRYRFRNLAQPWYQRVDEARTAIRDHYVETFRSVDQRVALAAERIEGASPLRALERGYAIVRAASGAVVPRAASVGPAEELTVQFSDDSITVRRVTNE